MSLHLRPSVRRIAGLTAAAGLAFAAALGSAGPAVAAPERPGAGIGPGVQIATPVAGGAELCTANFLYTAAGAADGLRDDEGPLRERVPAGKLYLGTAAHCMAAQSARSSIDGCVEPVQPHGTEVGIVGRDGTVHAGRVAYNSWVVMQERGESDPRLCLYNDFALIELGPAAAAVADPTVPGFGGPVGLNAGGTASGERVYSYQPNQLAPTPFKQGVSFGRPEGPRTHVVATLPPGVPGDSGSGYLDEQGRAFGVLSSLMLPTATNGVTDIAQALGYAAAYGPVGPVDLVPGTTGFTPDRTPLGEFPAVPERPLPDLTPVPLR
ncbi:serine protease [Pseudonocardia sp. NPDC049635]|uniref:serine protease n=1 Tax=Pseudonocardia sp. NPDC049635 TaxID=3155506 RepID=UPI0033D4FB6E